MKEITPQEARAIYDAGPEAVVLIGESRFELNHTRCLIDCVVHKFDCAAPRFFEIAGVGDDSFNRTLLHQFLHLGKIAL